MKRSVLFLAGIAALFVPLSWMASHRPEVARAESTREDWLKRVFDILLSTILLIIVLPLFIIIAVAIKLDSPGPVFYRATRAGRGGVPFKLYKFRTMVVDADKRGPGVTVAGDSRVTRVGRVLRRTKLDELPQLINVLQGDMSLVGPRPEDLRYVAMYTPEQRMVLSVRPGITGAASVHYRNEEALLTGPDWESRYIQEIMPSKLEHDLAYVREANVLKDIIILGRTALALFE